VDELLSRITTAGCVCCTSEAVKQVARGAVLCGHWSGRQGSTCADLPKKIHTWDCRVCKQFYYFDH
jgi:hypothetical protein